MARSDYDGMIIDSTCLDVTHQDVDGTISVSIRSGSANHIYLFYIDVGGNVGYKKSTDGGGVFGSHIAVDATDDYSNVAVWYDQWTPGDTTGTLIHIAATDTTDNSIIYFSHDTSATGTTGTVNLDSGASGSVDGITVNSIEIMSGAESFDTDLTTTATAVAANITAHTSTPDYSATSSGALITITSDDGDDADQFAVVSSATTITTTDVAMDSAGTNNNVLVHNPTTITPPAGVRSIAKGADNDIYIMNSANTTAGMYLHKSTDAGSSWTDKSDDAGGNDMTTEYVQTNSRGLVLPLLTDNDMMVLLTSETSNHAEAWLMDGITENFTVKDLNVGTQGWDKMSGTLDKTTGDLWIFGGDTGLAVHMLRYDASADLWDGKMINQGMQLSIALEVVGRVSVCRDQTDGVLMVSMLMGDFGTAMSPQFIFSSDDGKNWGNVVITRNNQGWDDDRYVYTPAMKLDTNEHWVVTWFNDDTDDLIMLLPQGAFTVGATAFPYRTVSGVVKDNAGTAVSGAEVKVFSNGTSPLEGYVRDSYHYHGTALTDGSGNYKCHVTDLSQSGQRFFAVANEVPVWHPAFKADFTNRGRWSLGNINIQINTTTKIIDWDAASGTQSYETIDMEAEMSNASTYEPLTMMARFKLDIDVVTQNVSTSSAALFVGFMTATASPDANTDHFGLRLRVKDDVQAIETTAGNAVNPVNGTATNTFTRGLTAETLYVQIQRFNATDWTLGLYSDEQFTTLLEEKVMTDLSLSITGGWRFTIGSDNLSTDHALSGTMDFVEVDFWTTGNIFNLARYAAGDPSSNAVDASLDVDID